MLNAIVDSWHADCVIACILCKAVLIDNGFHRVGSLEASSNRLLIGRLQICDHGHICHSGTIADCQIMINVSLAGMNVLQGVLSQLQC